MIAFHTAIKIARLCAFVTLSTFLSGSVNAAVQDASTGSYSCADCLTESGEPCCASGDGDSELETYSDSYANNFQTEGGKRYTIVATGFSIFVITPFVPLLTKTVFIRPTISLKKH